MNVTYMIQCADGTLYTGWTNDMDKRFQTHAQGKGAKYTRCRRPLTLVYVEECPTKQAAMAREFAIKRLSRQKKLDLIAHNYHTLKTLVCQEETCNLEENL